MGRQFAFDRKERGAIEPYKPKISETTPLRMGRQFTFDRKERGAIEPCKPNILTAATVDVIFGRKTRQRCENFDESGWLEFGLNLLNR